MTNFEVIKSMDVDTMSRFLINPIMSYKPCRYDCNNGYLNSECIGCIREWLEHDAERWDGLAKEKKQIFNSDADAT